ncbi:MAG: RNA polymerase sigma-70 factor [Bacteroidales bacterium]|nr:RNA polymerase sigma-70 factor [Bacteroidales bacterium]
MITGGLQIKIKSNDAEAFEKIFREYYSPLVLFALKIVNDQDVAEEIVQEFFYQYWKNRDQMSIKFSLKSYFYQSVRNNALKYLRHESVKQRYASGVANSGVSHSFSPDYGEKELQYIIENVLENLPQRCSRIFRMNRFEGLTYKEIAAKLSISVKTVEADMGKALKAFRNKLAKYQGYPV